MKNNISEKLSAAPDSPGVYLMKDEKGEIIYVGKAKSLKKRLSSYFLKTDAPDLKTGIMVSKVRDFDVILTPSENEALILEASLIKKHSPKYNILLKDGKQYPCLRLNPKEEYPALEIVRKIKKDGAVYFGPFSSGSAVRQTLELINRTFKLRKCKNPSKNLGRPCLNYQMGVCLGVCSGTVSPEEYLETIREVILVLKGRTVSLLKKLREDMQAAAEAEAYEKAAEIRDRIFSLERLMEKQSVVSSDLLDRDAMGIARDGDYVSVSVIFVRGGYVSGSRNYFFKVFEKDEHDILSSFISRFYDDSGFVPREVLTQVNLPDSEALSEYLAIIAKRKVSVFCPSRGEKTGIVGMAMENAEKHLRDKINARSSDMAVLEILKRRLMLPSLPRKIECFDNSNMAGTEPVSAMVVFSDAKPDKKHYRKYAIKEASGNDDYACMLEVIKRRYSKISSEEDMPDLLLIDGGRGQLSMALLALSELGLDNTFSVASIAKRDEKAGETRDKIYLPGRSNPVNFGKEDSGLLLLERIRDEAHRFVITFQRKRRETKTIRSVLDSIQGIGAKRKQTLLRHFKSIEAIAAAEISEIAALPGMNDKNAESLKTALSLIGFGNR